MNKNEEAVSVLKEQLQSIITRTYNADASGWHCDNVSILYKMGNEALGLSTSTKQRHLMAYLVKSATAWFNDGKMNGTDWCAFEREFDARLSKYSHS